MLRARRYVDLDLDHLIVEPEGMDARERRALTGRLKLLLAHLLTPQFPRERRGPSWEARIKEQRPSIEGLPEDNPSPRPAAAERLPGVVQLARVLAVQETGFPERNFPQRCSCSTAEILDPNSYSA